MAGYRDEMADLVSRNPGVQSRFPTTIEFPDYSLEQLMQIAERMLLQEYPALSTDIQRTPQFFRTAQAECRQERAR